MNGFILDSYALLCLFDRKRRAEGRAMRRYLEDSEHGKIALYMSKINEGEVFYKLYKYLGAEVAAGFRADMKKGLFPIQVVSVNDRRAEAASEVKARFNVSYADAFCIGLAQEMGLPVITGDPEFENVRDIINVKRLAG
jgi:predicted nucleic acid-binding protein